MSFFCCLFMETVCPQAVRVCVESFPSGTRACRLQKQRLLNALGSAGQQAFARDDGALVRAATDLAAGIMRNDIEDE